MSPLFEMLREANAIKAQAAKLAALKLFAIDVLKAWPLGDVDGGDLQEMAVKHGLLVAEKRTAQCREEGCNCAEYYSAEEWAEGITCYRRAKWLSQAEPTRSQKLADAGFKRGPSWRSLPSDE